MMKRVSKLLFVKLLLNRNFQTICMIDFILLMLFLFYFPGKIVLKMRIVQMVLETGIKINSRIISTFCNFEKETPLLNQHEL